MKLTTTRQKKIYKNKKKKKKKEQGTLPNECTFQVIDMFTYIFKQMSHRILQNIIYMNK